MLIGFCEEVFEFIRPHAVWGKPILFTPRFKLVRMADREVILACRISITSLRTVLRSVPCRISPFRLWASNPSCARSVITRHGRYDCPIARRFCRHNIGAGPSSRDCRNRKGTAVQSQLGSSTGVQCGGKCLHWPFRHRARSSSPVGSSKFIRSSPLRTRDVEKRGLPAA